MAHSAVLPENETERLKDLASFEILDTVSEQAYDDITLLASQICGCPIALVSLVDRDRQWFKSKVGLEVDETPRDLAFCAHAIIDPTELMVVPDARDDDRFASNPLVTSDPSIRFYAGAPLTTSNGNALGTLCVIDREPRTLSDDQRRALLALAHQVMTQLELRQTVSQLEKHAEERRAYQAQLERYQRELEANFVHMEELSTTDALTGLKNRRAFFDRLDQEILRAKRHGHSLSLALADIDRFKSFNDSFGHPDGDEALQQVAEILQREARESDFVSRYGGEEFAIVLAHTGGDGALVLAERFRRAIEGGSWTRRQITISIGLAEWQEGMDDDALVIAADRALYGAKHAGRNRTALEDERARNWTR